MNPPDCSFYAIANTDTECYLRVHYFDGEIHYRFDAEHVLDAKLFRNRIEAIACFTALVDSGYVGPIQVLAFNCKSTKFDV
jgi:hypothetical protein